MFQILKFVFYFLQVVSCVALFLSTVVTEDEFWHIAGDTYERKYDVDVRAILFYSLLGCAGFGFLLSAAGV